MRVVKVSNNNRRDKTRNNLRMIKMMKLLKYKSKNRTD